MKSILDLSYVKAYKYFMEPKNYCSLELPIYIDFKPILDYVASKIGNINFKDILLDSKKMPSAFENVNHKLLVKKDANYAYRPIQITNPYLYYFLVKIITNQANWESLKKRFKEFQHSNIEVSSIPKVKGKKDKSHRSASVTSWWENLEQRSLSLSLQYRYMFVTDITNCYGSIYTHTIAWAFMGKDEAKKKKDKNGLLGNEIDRYLQGMQYGQTNGIPQGSTLYDFIAEMVLGYADKNLSNQLASQQINDYKILRYRDDYRIFSNDKKELEQIAYYLQEVLTDLNFQLNSGKTFLTEDIISNSIKPDKLFYSTTNPLYKKTNKQITTFASSIQQEILYIHQFAKKYPNSGTLIKLLTTFSTRIRKTKRTITESDSEIFIAILTEIALGNPKAYKLILHLISILIEKISTPASKKRIVRFIYQKFKLIPNVSELQIWLQHITYKMSDAIAYNEPICQIVAGKPNIALWNNDWIKNEYKADFPLYKICTNWLRDSFTPEIDINEISLFEDY